MAQGLLQGLPVGVFDLTAHGQSKGDDAVSFFDPLNSGILNPIEFSNQRWQIITQDFP